MARPAKSDRRFLELHGTKWRVVVSVPRDLQKALGASKLKHTLDTDSLAEANKRKWSVIALLRAQIDSARNPHGKPKDLLKEALELAAIRRSGLSEEEEHGFDSYLEQRVDEIAGPPIGMELDGTAKHEPQRELAAIQFVGIATGKRTPIDTHRERYQAQLRVKARTLGDDDRAMRYLLSWCKAKEVSPFLETFGKREAIRFTDDFPALIGTNQARTLNKYIRRLGCYWKWMESRDEVANNVWQGRTYTVPIQTDEEKERPFTDEEVVKLLNGPASQHMHDLMRLGALTGARIDAIVSLRAKDCRDGYFIFKPQKKETSSRLCPIHPDLVEIVDRRTRGLEEEDNIFPEWPPLKSKKSQRERSSKPSNHFTTYRKKVGVDEQREGNRRGRINFHSFRRWFITRAERADQPEHIIAAVVGHKRQGITLGLYSAGPLLEQAKRCVESVKLP